MVVARRREVEIQSATQESDIIEKRLFEKISQAYTPTSAINTATVELEALGSNTLNTLSIEDLELLDTIPIINVKTELSNDIINSLRTLANVTNTTMREQLENAVDNYTIDKKTIEFGNLKFRNKSLKKCRSNVILNIRKIIDKIGNRPQVETIEVEKAIVVAIPDITDKRARTEYLKLFQDYSRYVMGTKQVEFLNLTGFTHEIDGILTELHRFKVGF